MIQDPQHAARESASRWCPARISQPAASFWDARASSTTSPEGRGSLKLRAKAATEKSGKDREAIIVTEIPFQVNKSRLMEHIAALVAEKRIEGISDVRDESDRDGMRIVIELKRGEQAEIILNNLYKHTQMQVNFGVIMLSIVNGQPRELGLIDVIKRFIEHRIDVVRRRTDYLLRKARDREHILLGFQKALDHLDEVIQLIRAAEDAERSARRPDRRGSNSPKSRRRPLSNCNSSA